jgi:protein TonB
MVAYVNISYLHFLAASIALHFAFLFLMSRTPPLRIYEPATIPVSVLEAPAKVQSELTPAPRTPAARSIPTPAIIAKKDTARLPRQTTPTRNRQNAEAEIIGRAEPLPVPSPQKADPAPANREVMAEQTIVVERPLPTMKELLPPANWSSSAPASSPVSLNTRDPVYVTYFTKIKQLIESNWEYPELALRYGLQGRLSLEFSIGGNGQLERLRVVRSSGSQLLDDEAVRAIRAAAPFPPIPPWIKPIPLSISAAMEYHDNRVHQFVR